jgi:hypothetical protein
VICPASYSSLGGCGTHLVIKLQGLAILFSLFGWRCVKRGRNVTRLSAIIWSPYLFLLLCCFATCSCSCYLSIRRLCTTLYALYALSPALYALSLLCTLCRLPLSVQLRPYGYHLPLSLPRAYSGTSNADLSATFLSIKPPILTRCSVFIPS